MIDENRQALEEAMSALAEVRASANLLNKRKETLTEVVKNLLKQHGSKDAEGKYGTMSTQFSVKANLYTINKQIGVDYEGLENYLLSIGKSEIVKYKPFVEDSDFEKLISEASDIKTKELLLNFILTKKEERLDVRPISKKLHQEAPLEE